jgi:LysM repeat protein
MRFNEFKSFLTEDKKKTYAIGDSHANAIAKAGGFVNLTKDGRRVERPENQAAVNQVLPGSVVVVSLGANNMLDENKDSVADQIADLLQTLVSKKCKVYYILFAETDNPKYAKDRNRLRTAVQSAIPSSVHVIDMGRLSIKNGDGVHANGGWYNSTAQTIKSESADFPSTTSQVPAQDSVLPSKEVGEVNQATKVSPSIYIVVSGDNLTHIAKEHGVPLADLIAANKQIKNPNKIYPGDKVIIPGGRHTNPTPLPPDVERGHPTMKDDPRIVTPPPSQASKPKKKKTFSKYEIANTESAGECFDFFKGKGLNDIQCAAFVGNFYEESKFNTRAHNEPENARGIVQWRLDRLSGLANFAKKVKKKWHDFELQLDYTWHELTGRFKKVLPALDRNKNNLEECVRIVMDDYEVANPISYPKRLGYAESAMRLFGTETERK